MKTKIQQFCARSRYRNPDLYTDSAVSGRDYVICPVSGARMLIIRTDYITNVLGMTVEEYDKQYPHVQKRCESHRNNIKAGLHKIDPETGLTKYQLSQVLAREKLSSVDADGVSGYKRKGQKTRATHMLKVDEQGRNGYSQLASKAIIKGNQTKAEKGLITFNEDRTEFYRYKLIVLYLTQQHRKEITEGYVTGLAGKENAWHIDHMFSILKGYQQKISPFVIGHRRNLKMIPWKDNISKHSKCSIDINQLFTDVDYTSQQSSLEYAKIMKIINNDIKNNIPPNAAYLLERFHESTICN